LKIVCEMLEKDTTLSDRTKIPILNIVELLYICVQSRYFQVGDQFYKQTIGMATGGVLSPILCNSFMEKFERDAINLSDTKLRVWLRYVDDVFLYVGKIPN
jgi:retron-type reverse transcriptase